MDISYWLITLAGLAMAALVGWLFAHQRAQRDITQLREDKARLSSQLEAQQAAMEEKSRGFEEARKQFENTFKSLASDVLRSNSSEFLKLAETNFKTLHTKASGDLEQREKAVENMVKPIREALDKTDQQVRKMEKERQTAFGSLNQHLQFMAQAQEQLQGETRNLVKALRRPEVRGQWGELTLRRLAELAGMVEHCDFDQQRSVDTDQGKQRPDMVVRLPGSREIIVDAKLLEDAMADKVILATPSSLVALLRAVAFGWRQETLAENAEQIRSVGQDLYERLSTFTEHLEKLGSHLSRGVDSYNKAVGSFDSRVLPGARKFNEMGIQGKKDLTELEPVERLPRPVQGDVEKSGDVH